MRRCVGEALKMFRGEHRFGPVGASRCRWREDTTCAASSKHYLLEIALQTVLCFVSALSTMIWVLCEAMFTMADKREFKGARLPSDLTQKVELVAKWLMERGFQSRENFSEALAFILRRAEKAGLLDPPTLDDSFDKALTGLEVANDRAKSAIAQKPKK